MRKTIVASDGYVNPWAEGDTASLWLDLASLARVEISSEDPDYPVERALVRGAAGAVSAPGSPSGWRAGLPGPQTLRLLFDKPQSISRVLVHFREAEHERMQEFALHSTLANGQTQEIVRQGWSFSPGGSVLEEESYAVSLAGVTTLTLWIDPDRGRDRYPATLELLRIEA